MPNGKKFALVTLYKTWSAFTKSLKYTFEHKRKNVIIHKIGLVYSRQSGTDEIDYDFLASSEVKKLF